MYRSHLRSQHALDLVLGFDRTDQADHLIEQALVDIAVAVQCQVSQLPEHFVIERIVDNAKSGLVEGVKPTSDAALQRAVAELDPKVVLFDRGSLGP